MMKSIKEKMVLKKSETEVTVYNSRMKLVWKKGGRGWCLKNISVYNNKWKDSACYFQTQFSAVVKCGPLELNFLNNAKDYLVLRDDNEEKKLRFRGNLQVNLREPLAAKIRKVNIECWSEYTLGKDCDFIDVAYGWKLLHGHVEGLAATVTIFNDKKCARIIPGIGLNGKDLCPGILPHAENLIYCPSAYSLTKYMLGSYSVVNIPLAAFIADNDVTLSIIPYFNKGLEWLLLAKDWNEPPLHRYIQLRFATPAPMDIREGMRLNGEEEVNGYFILKLGTEGMRSVGETCDFTFNRDYEHYKVVEDGKRVEKKVMKFLSNSGTWVEKEGCGYFKTMIDETGQTNPKILGGWVHWQFHAPSVLYRLWLSSKNEKAKHFALNIFEMMKILNWQVESGPFKGTAYDYYNPETGEYHDFFGNNFTSFFATSEYARNMILMWDLTGRKDKIAEEKARKGFEALIRFQNRDGSIPSFYGIDDGSVFTINEAGTIMGVKALIVGYKLLKEPRCLEAAKKGCLYLRKQVDKGYYLRGVEYDQQDHIEEPAVLENRDVGISSLGTIWTAENFIELFHMTKSALHREYALKLANYSKLFQMSWHGIPRESIMGAISPVATAFNHKSFEEACQYGIVYLKMYELDGDEMWLKRAYTGYECVARPPHHIEFDSKVYGGVYEGWLSTLDKKQPWVDITFGCFGLIEFRIYLEERREHLERRGKSKFLNQLINAVLTKR